MSFPTTTTKLATCLRRLAYIVAILAVVVLAFILHIRQQENWRLQQISDILRQKAAEHNLDYTLVQALIWKESRYDSQAIGSKGEIGLMQIMDGAVSDWARVNKQPKPQKSDLFDPSINLEIGCWYLANACRHWSGYHSQKILALAEYNAGKSNVDKLWKPADPATKIHPSDITFPSTRSYISQIIKKQHSILNDADDRH